MSIVYSRRHHFELNTELEMIKLNFLLNIYLYLSLNASNDSQSLLHGSPCRVMPLYLSGHKRKSPNGTKASESCLKPLPLHRSIGALSVTFPDLGENTNVTQATPLGKKLLLPRDFFPEEEERCEKIIIDIVPLQSNTLPASLKAIAYPWDGETPPFPKSFKDPAFSIHSLHLLNIVRMGCFAQLDGNRG